MYIVKNNFPWVNPAIKPCSFFQFCLNKNETNNKKQTDIGKIKN